MKERLEILKKLLCDDGVIFVHIDNNQIGNLKVLMDEIFFERNFVQMISEKRSSPAGFKTINPGPLTVTDYILMYASEKKLLIKQWKNQYIPVDYDENYDLVLLNPKAPPKQWKFKKIHDIIYKKWGFRAWRDAKEKWGADWKSVRHSICGTYALENYERVVSVRDPHKPSAEIKEFLEKSKNKKNKVFVMERKKHDDIYFFNGGALSFYKNKIKEIDGKLVPTEILTDLWTDINYAGIAEEGGVKFKNNKKPEMLLKRIIEMGSKPGDLVLDSFLGGGTTAAVAHKMGRRWIGIELKDYAKTECLPRLQRVVEGKDDTGISKKISWKGGGGFRYLELGESLFKIDEDKTVLLNLKGTELIEAICLNQGFKFVGKELSSKTRLHGYIGSKRFCNITENLVTQDYVESLANEISLDKSLVIYCTKHMSNLDIPENVELKKMPKDILKGYDID